MDFLITLKSLILNYWFVFAIYGLFIGSFLNVLIYRIPNYQSITFPASHCYNCKNSLKWYHNIPVLSYLFLKGECGFCKTKISIQYPLIELTNMFIWIILYFTLEHNFYLIITAIIFSILLVLSMIDFKYKLVPDNLNLLALTLSIFSSSSIINNIQMVLMMTGFMILLKYFAEYFINRKVTEEEDYREALGEGDVIVAGSMGGLLGSFQLFFIALFISAILAILPSLYNRIKNKDLELPFVPFLILGTFLSIIYKDLLLNII